MSSSTKRSRGNVTSRVALVHDVSIQSRKVDEMKKKEYIVPKLTVVGTATDVTRGNWKAGGHTDKYLSGPGIFYSNIS